MKLQLAILLLGALICSARDVEVHNYGRGPVVVSSPDWWLELPPGVNRLDLEDGAYTLSNTNGATNVTVGGEFGVANRFIVGGNGASIHVDQVNRHDVVWFFCLGIGFGIPIVGYGFARRMFQTLGGGYSEES